MGYGRMVIHMDSRVSSIKELLNIVTIMGALMLTIAVAIPMSLAHEELFIADYNCELVNSWSGACTVACNSMQNSMPSSPGTRVWVQGGGYTRPPPAWFAEDQDAAWFAFASHVR